MREKVASILGKIDTLIYPTFVVIDLVGPVLELAARTFKVEIICLAFCSACFLTVYLAHLLAFYLVCLAICLIYLLAPFMAGTSRHHYGVSLGVVSGISFDFLFGVSSGILFSFFLALPGAPGAMSHHCGVLFGILSGVLFGIFPAYVKACLLAFYLAFFFAFYLRRIFWQS